MKAALGRAASFVADSYARIRWFRWCADMLVVALFFLLIAIVHALPALPILNQLVALL